MILMINVNHSDVNVIEGLTSIAIGKESITLTLGQSCIEQNIL
jgi:hypothetical protein